MAKREKRRGEERRGEGPFPARERDAYAKRAVPELTTGEKGGGRSTRVGNTVISGWR